MSRSTVLLLARGGLLAWLLLIDPPTAVAAGRSEWPALPDGWLRSVGGEAAGLVVLPNGFEDVQSAGASGVRVVEDPSAAGALDTWLSPAAGPGGRGFVLHDVIGRALAADALAVRWPGGGEDAPAAVAVAVPEGDFFVHPGLAVGHKVAAPGAWGHCFKIDCPPRPPAVAVRPCRLPK